MRKAILAAGHESRIVKPFHPVEQLELILNKWEPEQRVDIQGIMIDYIYRSGRSLHDVLISNMAIYKEIFVRGSKERQLNLLEAICTSDEDITKHIRPCADTFSKIKMLEDEIFSRIKVTGENQLQKCSIEKFLEQHEDATVFWQLSDIHFGCLNVWPNDPVELASALVYAVSICPYAKPDYILVSGDISTMGADDEFDAFIKFCRTLSTRLWGEVFPQRILVIPGNHDTVFCEDGGTDGLANFASRLENANCCILPFGSATASYENPDVLVTRYRYQDDFQKCPPLALINLKETAVEFLLLVSADRSGQIPENLRSLLREGVSDNGEVIDAIISHNRADSGEISLEYLSLFAQLPDVESKAARIAMTHHNLVSYGPENAQNKNAFATLRTLRNKGVNVVLHGHLHMFEGNVKSRVEIPDMAFCIPCSTLCSYPVHRSRGFMMHVLSNAPQRDLLSLVWEISDEFIFTAEGIQPAYLTHALGDGPILRRGTE
jgi:3',5'-cyclic AMP phosphodiesterase CpdA